MDFIKMLIQKRDALMDKYVSLIKKPQLSEQEIILKNTMHQELIRLDLQIEDEKNQLEAS
jgi:hypothetical protein